MPTLEILHECVEPFIEHRGEQRGFWLRKPRAIGNTILIARKGFPVPDSQKDRKAIFLDVKSAFGTGGHGTTEGCLLALERHLREKETVLDVGTGSGILAIAASRLGAGPITAVDIDGGSCREARKNIAANGIADGVDVIEGGIQSAEGRFDLIVANIRTPVLAELAEELIGKLHAGGIVILSGIMERELHPFLALLETYPVEMVETRKIRGWMTMVLRKRAGTHSPAERRGSSET